jgi:apolipoprotein N-acyltransferase
LQNTLNRSPSIRNGLALLLGGVSVFGFAPFYLYPLPIVALAGLFHLWRGVDTPRAAAWLGFWFGLGLFGGGVSWIYVSLHDFGGMPWLSAMLATLAFCAFLALFPALAGSLSARFSASPRLIAIPALWVLIEWVRGWIFTGFPWLAMGYSQVPYSPLAGIAPVFGIFGVSLATTACAAIIAAYVGNQITRRSLLLALAGFWLTGAALKHIEWSEPAGAPTSFSLLQGNIPQDLKWHEAEFRHTLQTYLMLTQKSRAQLIVLPEMALPVLPEDLPENYLATLAQHARNNGGDVLVGYPERAVVAGEFRYYNTMASLGVSPPQAYRKTHLVPFGEFIPFKPLIGWIYRDFLHIPLADLAPGPAIQHPLQIGGQKVAVNICYEDVFGEEIIRQLPEATLLVNVSNDAWYGHSLASHQHLQMSQARALETARMALRSTNTGATAVIDRDGRVVAQAPHFALGSLDGIAQGFSGSTPYVRWGNWPAICAILLVIGLLWGRKKK